MSKANAQDVEEIFLRDIYCVLFFKQNTSLLHTIRVGCPWINNAQVYLFQTIYIICFCIIIWWHSSYNINLHKWDNQNRMLFQLLRPPKKLERHNKKIACHNKYVYYAVILHEMVKYLSLSFILNFSQSHVAYGSSSTQKWSLKDVNED